MSVLPTTSSSSQTVKDRARCWFVSPWALNHTHSSSRTYTTVPYSRWLSVHLSWTARTGSVNHSAVCFLHWFPVALLWGVRHEPHGGSSCERMFKKKRARLIRPIAVYSVGVKDRGMTWCREWWVRVTVKRGRSLLCFGLALASCVLNHNPLNHWDKRQRSKVHKIHRESER